MKKESNNNGCFILGIIAFFFSIWGFMGMTDGHSFSDGIFNNLKALLIIVIAVLVLYSIIKMNEK